MPLPKHEYTAEDYWALPDGTRAELIDGELWDLASPSRTHQRLALELAADLRDFIREHGGSCEVKADYMFWQATDSAMVGGINGNVDQDFWYIKPGEVYKTRAKGKKKQVSIAECNIKFADDSAKLKNRKAEPEFEITLDDKELKEGRDFECGYLNNTQSGTGYLYVRGIRKYKDWRIVSFTIE